MKRSSTVGAAAMMLLVGALGMPGGVLMAQDSHVVRPGETLWGISGARYGQPTRWPEVQKSNRVDEPRRLQPGTVLYFENGRPLGENEAMVLAVTGEAWRQRGGQAATPLQAGVAVSAGDVLRTAAGGFLTLGLPGGSRSVIPAGSAVEVEQIDRQRVRLRLLEGEVESQVRKQPAGTDFEIRSRSVVLGVRGTRFRVREQQEQVLGEVLEGRVAVTRQGERSPVFVDAGQGAVVGDSGALVPPTALLPAPRYADDAAAQVAPETLAVRPVPGAQGYRWRVAADEGFLAPRVELTTTGTEVALPTGLDPGFYHLRVAAVDANRLEGMPGDRVFYLQAPRGGMRWTAEGRAELHWSGSSARRYRLELSREPDFASLISEQTGLQATGAVVGPFAVGGRYYWRVSETADGSTYGAPFVSGSFEVPSQ